MTKEKKSKVSYFQSNITATVSVALVLVLVGVVAFLMLTAQKLGNNLKENIGFSIVLKGDASADDEAQLNALFKKAPYVAKVEYISKDAALQQWKNDTGEDLVETFGVNPLSAEYQVNVKSEYASVAKMKAIQAQLQQMPMIEEIVMYEAEVNAANENITNISMVLLAVAALLVLISFVLINNTVRLTVYSRRFLIHTMKLVGAKPGFIRKPFVVQKLINGVIAGMVACGALMGLYYAANSFEIGLGSMFLTSEIIIVFCGLLVAGALICGISAFFAADKYIRLDYDDLFKR